MKIKKIFSIVMIVISVLAAFISFSMANLFAGVHDGIAIIMFGLGIVCSLHVGYSIVRIIEEGKK